MRVERHVRPEIDAKVVDVRCRKEVSRRRQRETRHSGVNQETVDQSGRAIDYCYYIQGEARHFVRRRNLNTLATLLATMV